MNFVKIFGQPTTLAFRRGSYRKDSPGDNYMVSDRGGKYVVVGNKKCVLAIAPATPRGELPRD
ncbi:MAG: hypothetical protein P5702_04285 [Limnospira sp. PMC 1291.21]|uniref:Uncharacterized protein n=2 Tax=Limnospira TaxID=2596745 RepID=A0A9P1KLZ3_9CYAN|nr:MULTISPECIES: hypothetical protein [Limnospira]AMW26643.1 hypothetical protein AP285_00185 [Arthrospira platensis YZ]EKD09559.1 hypothetical protein SPLC1_S170080 [Arthrospira platensis C1]MDC0837345.1 hypothetical protein [Limnoraphis robusta]MDT9202352.1 hypothetical protein [Limnospira sp. PMC 1243.20]MDT9207322.1 hypothetical protein [Limnospira sp. PMC 1252.20]MDT9222801.1 hypothetical protein [Limnospira sp. PMC 1279.21]MDT9242894.1 hypothetical protein [Limnospira sp. PMC 1249.20]